MYEGELKEKEGGGLFEGGCKSEMQGMDRKRERQL